MTNDPASIKTLKKHSRRNVEGTDEYEALFEELGNSSDRGAAILAASLIDFQLQDFLTLAMPNCQKELINPDELFGGSQSLGSFSAKINVSFAMELIDIELYSEIHTIREIRNAFAHGRSAMHFSQPEVSNVVLRLKYWTYDRALTFSMKHDDIRKAIDNPDQRNNWSLKPVNHPRLWYQTATAFTIQYIRSLIIDFASEKLKFWEDKSKRLKAEQKLVEQYYAKLKEQQAKQNEQNDTP